MPILSLRTLFLPGTPPRRFWRSLTVFFAVVSLILLIIFRLFPGLDIATSMAFFDPALCPGREDWCIPFTGQHDPFLMIYQEWGVVLQRGIGLVTLLMAAAYGWTRRGRIRTSPVARYVCGAALSLFLGPILLVNWILKAYWGRPRPRATDIFLGDDPFILAGTNTDYCYSNCSFVSGEASGIFWFFALLPLLAHFAGREIAWAGGVVMAVIASTMAFNRTAFGAHYLSDVTLAATFTLTLVAASHYLLSPRIR